MEGGRGRERKVEIHVAMGYEGGEGGREGLVIQCRVGQ